MKNIQIDSTFGKISVNIAVPQEDFHKAVIVMPGFLDSKDYFHLVELIQDLSDKGYLALSFDPTGIWESEGGNENYSISQYLYDLQKILDWVKSNYPQINDIAIGGHSMGGVITMLYAKDNQNSISKVFTIMSPAQFPGSDAMKTKITKWKETGIKHSTRTSSIDGTNVDFILPYSFVEDAEQYQNQSFSNIKIPKLFIAGANDPDITPEIVKKIYDAMSEPKRYEVIKGALHDYRMQPGAVMAINKLIIEFLEG